MSNQQLARQVGDGYASLNPRARQDLQLLNRIEKENRKGVVVDRFGRAWQFSHHSPWRPDNIGWWYCLFDAEKSWAAWDMLSFGPFRELK